MTVTQKFGLTAVALAIGLAATPLAFAQSGNLGVGVGTNLGIGVQSGDNATSGSVGAGPGVNADGGASGANTSGSIGASGNTGADLANEQEIRRKAEEELQRNRANQGAGTAGGTVQGGASGRMPP